MHDTALRTGEAFFKCYGFPGCRVLDVGSMDVNGTLRPVARENSVYTGIDTSDGPGVDHVIQPGQFPFDDSSFDLVVSSSSLEHDPVFWVTFLEMCRVVRPGGFVYISAPSNGPVHRHPVDCWRFYPDSAEALMKWVNSSQISGPFDLIESFRMFPSSDGWVDQVCVFGKRPFKQRPQIRAFVLNSA